MISSVLSLSSIILIWSTLAQLLVTMLYRCIFSAGEMSAVCHVMIIDDSIYEEEETFSLGIVTRDGVKTKRSASVTITDEEDSE